MRKKGGRVKRAVGGDLVASPGQNTPYTAGPANYQPGFVQNAFGTGNLQHLQTAGMMGTGDTVNRTNDYLQGKFSFDPSGTVATQAAGSAPQQIENAYRLYLDRNAEQGGLDYWDARRKAGLSVNDLGKNIQNSPEYASRWGLPAPKPEKPVLQSTDQTPSGRVIDQMYINYLGRLPEAEGKNYWLGQLNSGMSPADIQKMFLNSQEGTGYAKNQQLESIADSMQQSAAPNPYNQSQDYFKGVRTAGSMPGSMVPSLANRNAEQLAYQMSPAAQLADQQMLDQELAQKKEIIKANQDWQAAEDARQAKIAEIQGDYNIAKAREDEIARQQAEAAAAQQRALAIAMMFMMRCDARAKTNVVYVGDTGDGVKLYAFDYVEDLERCKITGEAMPPKRIGPMAQDLMEIYPDRVIKIGDTLAITGTYELGPAPL